MKRYLCALLSLLLLLAMTGCSTNTDSTSESASASTAESSEETTDTEETAVESTDTVDYDLTGMSSDMVYAMVYQMVYYPDTFIGKTVRMSGTYYVEYYYVTEQYYHYCFIQDAAACCAAGVEFVWADATDVSAYTEVDAEIIVEGTFETYTEPNDDSLYFRLSDATLEVV